MRQVKAHLIAWILLAICILTGLQSFTHQTLSDWRFGSFKRQASGEIVVITIDALSISQMGVWPWPRELHARLLDQISRAKATDIAFDIDFSSPSRPEDDQAFLAALEKAGGSVILASFRQYVDVARQLPAHVNTPLPAFAKASWVSLVNVALDRDGLVRRYPFGENLEGAFVPSMGAMLAGSHTENRNSFPIDYSIDARTIPTVSYSDVLKGDEETLKKLANRKVIIGATAIELGDRFNVPNGQVIAGPVLQALAAETIMQGRILLQASDLVRLAAPLLLSLVLYLLWGRLRPLPKAALIFCSLILFEVMATVVQAKSGLIIDSSLFHLASVAYLVALAIHEIDFRGWLGRIAEQRFQRIAMSLGDGLVCADKHGLITVWNPGAEAIFGYEREAIIGQPFSRLIASEEGGAFALTSFEAKDLRRAGGKMLELDGRRETGEVFSLEACFSCWETTDGLHYGAILRDISQRKLEAERIRYLAEHDTLTGLINRNSLQLHLEKALTLAKEQDSKLALIVVGLEKFHVVNTMRGHEFGDLVLKAATARLQALNPDADVIARISGDEFALLFTTEPVVHHPEQRAATLHQAFSETPLIIDQRRQTVAVRIGLVMNDEEHVSAETFLGNAQIALNRAKALALGSSVTFAKPIREELQARVTIEAELVLAYERGEFELFYQPQVDLETGVLVGVESLIRWRHPERGLVSPAQFMPVINSSMISDRVAFWVLETACRQGKMWQDRGLNIRMGINLSPSLIDSGDLLATVSRVLEKTRIAPSLVELEVTEDIVLTDDSKITNMFRSVQDLGVRVVFDDFGTGFAGLSYLKKFPLDGLKIDQTFVRDLMTSTDDAAIVSTTIMLSKLLGRSVIAEGIEDADTARKLRDMGCHEGQGYHFGRPLPIAEFEAKFMSESPEANAPFKVVAAA